MLGLLSTLYENLYQLKVYGYLVNQLPGFPNDSMTIHDRT